MFRVKLNMDNLNARVQKVTKEIQSAVMDELYAFGDDVVRDAKDNVPVDEGILKNSISSKNENLAVSITVNADYAAYMEFGTRSFAAAHVASLPTDWQTFAASFKGGGGGSFEELLMRITEWVKRKGIEPEAAYPIARKIMIKGIRSQPFLYPAVEKNRVELQKRLKAL